ncbi:FecR domain-containing protein [Candidatus Gracilibacteria bacterium]|nr:FecR domain-containing protein [Candidatus Gracilibacteria bacterium]
MIGWLFSCSSDEKIEYSIETATGIIQTGTIVSQEITLNTAYVSEVFGTVTSKNSNGSTNSPIAGDLIEPGDTITTGDTSGITITFKDYTIVRLGSKSSLSIKSIEQNNESFHLVDGELWGRILRPFTEKSFFQIETTDVSAGVRGSSVYVVKNSTGSTVLMLDSGEIGNLRKINVTRYASGSTNEIVELQPGEMMIIFSSGGTSLRKKIDMGRVYKDSPFIYRSTNDDILFMNALLKRKYHTFITGSTEERFLPEITKIRNELSETLPASYNSNEIEGFFLGEIRNSIKNNTPPEEILQFVREQIIFETFMEENICGNDTTLKTCKESVLKIIRDPSSKSKIIDILDGKMDTLFDQDPLISSGTLLDPLRLKKEMEDSIQIALKEIKDIQSPAIRTEVKKPRVTEPIRKITTPLPEENPVIEAPVVKKVNVSGE